MRKRFKRVGAAVLSLAMIVGVMSAVTKPIEVQAANSAPGAAYWTDADGLGSFGMSSSDTTIAKIRFGLNGSDAREWAICGKDGNDLALLSTTGFANAAYGSNSKYSTSNFVTDIKKYVSNSNNTSTYLGSTYFNNAELDKMQTVTVKTLEYDQTGTREVDGSAVTSKLYLPDYGFNGNYEFFVGANTDIVIYINKLTAGNGFQTNFLWLRSPIDGTATDLVYIVFPDGNPLNGLPGSGSSYVYATNVSVVPAVNLNLSSVIFASSAKAASSSYIGDIVNSAMTANTYTLRYASNGSEAAVFSADDTSVQVSGASSGMYLMVQNSNGVYIADASTNPLVNASSITINGTALTDFDNCEMWLESTTDRITTAKIIKTNHIKTNHVNTENQTANFSACNHDYEWDVEREPTETEDGEAVYKCTKCGNISARQLLTAYQYYILTSTNKIKNAKAGSTVTISSKYWNSFPKSFFEQLAKRRDITVKIDFPYDSKNYEITISPTQKIDTSNSKVKYYGPKNLIGTYNAVEVKAK